MFLLPSLERPDNLRRFIDSYVDTDATVTVVLRLHRNTKHYEECVNINLPPNWMIRVGPRMTAPQCMQEHFEAFPNAPFYGFLGDDVVFKTKGWDKILIEAADDWYIAWGKDGIHNKKLCTHPCIGGEAVRAVGWWALPGLYHNFVDTVWMYMGMHVGNLRFCPQVEFDHRHPIVGKAVRDPIYTYAMARYQQDETRFARWQVDSYRDIKRLRDAFGSNV